MKRKGKVKVKAAKKISKGSRKNAKPRPIQKQPIPDLGPQLVLATGAIAECLRGILQGVQGLHAMMQDVAKTLDEIADNVDVMVVHEADEPATTADADESAAGEPAEAGDFDT